MKNLIDKISDFIINEYFGFNLGKQISGNTRIREDLGIDGDDAVEFFEKLEKKFNVDLKELNIARYFYGEGFSLFTFIINLIKVRKKSITIKDLAISIKAGKWIDPE